MLHARSRAGLTQEEVANRMGTKAPAIVRLEAIIARSKSSSSVKILCKYVRTVGCALEIHLRPL